MCLELAGRRDFEVLRHEMMGSVNLKFTNSRSCCFYGRPLNICFRVVSDDFLSFLTGWNGCFGWMDSFVFRFSFLVGRWFF